MARAPRAEIASLFPNGVSPTSPMTHSADKATIAASRRFQVSHAGAPLLGVVGPLTSVRTDEGCKLP